MTAVKIFTSRFVSITGILCLGWIFLSGDCAAQSAKNITVVVSQRIRPYMLVLEGMDKGLAGQNIHLAHHYLDGEAQIAETKRDLSKGEYDLLVGIGPEAMSLIASMNLSGLYSAVLTPHPEFSCGVSLQIPVHTQLREMKDHFPTMKRVGILFDPRQNADFYEKAEKSANFLDMIIVPLQVASIDLLSSVLRKNWDRIDCLWMIPDPTIISAPLVQYIIKQALFQKKGVMGYNHFFIQSGALFAFEFDYEALGRQTAEQIIRHLSQGQCFRQPPVYRTKINQKIARKLGVKWREETP